jgi:hypothetical protein
MGGCLHSSILRRSLPCCLCLRPPGRGIADRRHALVGALAVLPISKGGSRSLSRLTMEYGDFESTAEPRCAHLSVIYRAITATSCKPLRRQRWRRQMMAAAASISFKQKFRYVITSRLFEICVLAFQNVLNFQNPFRCRRVVSCLRWKLEIPWCQS